MPVLPVRELGLKAGAAALTLAAAAAAALYVSTHVRARAAPLQPAVVTVSPAVTAGEGAPTTSTYVS
jgi:hypothetical protein